MNECFQFFLKKFGEPCCSRPVEGAHLDRYRGRVPQLLLDVWVSHGFGGYRDGLFWLVDPADYEGVLERFLAPTALMGRDEYQLIARTAFGALEAWGRTSGPSLRIDPAHGFMLSADWARPWIAQGKEHLTAESFFASREPAQADFAGEDETPLFAAALERFGPLSEREMYAFVPALALGGTARIDRLEKVEILPHLDLLAELGPLQVLRGPS